MVESSPSVKESNKGRPTKAVRHLKMKVIPNLGAKTIIHIVKEQLEPSVELTTDDSTSYIRFDKLAGNHKTVTSGKEAVKTFLP